MPENYLEIPSHNYNVLVAPERHSWVTKKKALMPIRAGVGLKLAPSSPRLSNQVPAFLFGGWGPGPELWGPHLKA